MYILLWVVPGTSRHMYTLCEDIKEPGAREHTQVVQRQLSQAAVR